MMSDNYAYLIIDKATSQVGVVDPSVPEAIMDELKKQQVTFTH